MLVKNIISECLSKLGMDPEAHNDGEDSVVKALLDAANSVYCEIATDYLPLVAREKAVFDEGFADVSALAKRILYVVAVRKDGIAKGYKLYPDYIESTFRGEGEIEYAYLPDEFAFDGELSDTRIPEWLFAEGVCAEYCYRNNMSDMAEAFAAKFKESLLRLKNKGSSKYLKARRWS